TRPSEGGSPGYAPLNDAAKERLRGITGLVTGPTPPTAVSNRHLFELAKKLEAGTEVVQGAWMRRLDLDNPR
ncbi:MAG TPA: hypothetical protein VFO11_05020, partial [Candidatus Polarisedimenticolaceae bacterium]|nr:hypothetical protein [Candidatus Polarisedimenticolaceae bacterium]